METSKVVRLSAAIFMVIMAILNMGIDSSIPRYLLIVGIVVYGYGMMIDPENEEETPKP